MAAHTPQRMSVTRISRDLMSSSFLSSHSEALRNRGLISRDSLKPNFLLAWLFTRETFLESLVLPWLESRVHTYYKLSWRVETCWFSGRGLLKNEHIINYTFLEFWMMLWHRHTRGDPTSHQHIHHLQSVSSELGTFNILSCSCVTQAIVLTVVILLCCWPWNLPSCLSTSLFRCSSSPMLRSLHQSQCYSFLPVRLAFHR